MTPPPLAESTLEPPQTAPVPVAPSLADRIADPGPLGLAAFALTTFVLSTFNAGLLDVAVEPVVFGLALFYGGIVQVFAGLVEYLKGNTFGATAFCSYGAFWMAFWYMSTNPQLLAKADPASIGKGVGLFLLAWTFFTAYMLVTSARTNGALFVTFTVLTATFICLTLGKFTGSALWTHLGGYLGLITAFLAWYTSFAGVLNNTAGRTVLPVFPLPKH